MQTKLPNLELITHKAQQLLDTPPHEEFDLMMFSQIWSSSCTAFDIDNNFRPAITCKAMTKAYTTVAIERYGCGSRVVVFIGNEPCYILKNPTTKFFDDLQQKNLAARSIAIAEYSDYTTF